MKNSNRIIFTNIDFYQLKWTVVIFLVFVTILYLFYQFNVVSLFLSLVFYALIFAFIHPVNFVIEEDKLIYEFLFYRKKIIKVSDITEINLSNPKFFAFKYRSEGFKTPTHQKIRLRSLDIRILQEELMKRNPNITIIYS